MPFRLFPRTFAALALVALAAPAGAADRDRPITPTEVTAAQQAWGAGIVTIGKAFEAGGETSAREAAQRHLDRYYGFGLGDVLFKPTLAAEDPFRTDPKQALSYFVGGDPDHAEDKGFALRPWTQVRWENVGTKIHGGMAVAMGHYYFTPADGTGEVKVEYSFAYVRDSDGRLRIILHDSSLPYDPTG